MSDMDGLKLLEAKEILDRFNIANEAISEAVRISALYLPESTSKSIRNIVAIYFCDISDAVLKPIQQMYADL